MSPNFSYGSGRGPTDEEVERIQFLCDKAGIITGYWLLQKPVSIELTEAKSRGLIDVDIYGDNSLDRVQINIHSKTNDPLEIAVLPGTIFTARSADVQSMVVVRKEFLALYPHETMGPCTIGAACANMRLDMPSEDDYLGLSITPTSEDLMKLLGLPDFQKEPLRVRQFAVWTITDNPASMEYVGIGTLVSSSGPTHAEMEKVRLLFVEAGISVDKYNALRN